MNFIEHKELKDKHALLAPSQPFWIKYSEEQLFQKYVSSYAQIMGTALHELAETLIRNSVKMKKTDRNVILVHLLKSGIPKSVIDIDRIFNNFVTYVNDAIGFRLTPEQPLKYSDYCFGTADAISFRNNLLRIHDYKSGVTQPKMEQLLAYAALFCLEYKYKPGEIDIELRLYYNDEIIVMNPTAEDVLPVMDAIVRHTKYLRELNGEV